MNTGKVLYESAARAIGKMVKVPYRKAQEDGDCGVIHDGHKAVVESWYHEQEERIGNE